MRVVTLTSQCVPTMATIAPEIAAAMDFAITDAKMLLREVDLDVSQPGYCCLYKYSD